MLTKLVLIVSLTTIVYASYAQVYKWTDSQGGVHFSDHPHAGAEIIKMPDVQSYIPPSISNPSTTRQDKEGTDSTLGSYIKVEITQPENKATIRNNQGYLVVAVQLDPELSKGDTLQMVFDGASLGDPQTSLSFELNGVYRGTHTIAVQVLNAGGGIIKSSETITFFMHRTHLKRAHLVAL